MPTSAARRRQAYAAYAGSSVNLERSGAAHAAVTVEKSVTTLLRFLGYLANVEASPAPPSLSAVLDGDALARYVAFSLTVRCDSSAAAGSVCTAHTLTSHPFTLAREGTGSQAASRRTWHPSCS